MLIQNKVGHENWGKYAALYSLCHISITLADLGLNQYLTKEIARNKNQIIETTGKILTLKLLTSATFPLCMVFIGYFLGYEIIWLKMLFIIAIIHSFIQLFGFYRAQIQGNQFFGLDALVSNLDKSILIFVSFALVYSTSGIYSYITGRILSIAIATIVILVLCYKNNLVTKPSKKLIEINSIIKLSFPFAFISLVYSVNENIDQVMIERLSQKLTNFNHSSIYSAAYRLVNAVMMYLWIILPMFFAKFSHFESNKSKNDKLIKVGTSIVYLPIALISIFALFHSRLLFIFFKNSSIVELNAMSEIFSILCLTLLLQGLFAILSTFLTSNGEEKYITKLVLVSIAFNITTNFIYIPKYGAYAASWATFGSAIIVVIGYILKILKTKTIELPIKLWVKLIVISLASYIGFYIGLTHSEMLSIILGISLFIFSTIAIKPIVIKDLKEIG